MEDEKKVECCELGKAWIHWMTPEQGSDLDEAAFVLALKDSYPDPVYEPILFCPFCGHAFLEDNTALTKDVHV